MKFVAQQFAVNSWRFTDLNTKLDPLQCFGARKFAIFCAATWIPPSRNPIKMHCFATSFSLSLELLEARKLHVSSTRPFMHKALKYIFREKFHLLEEHFSCWINLSSLNWVCICEQSLNGRQQWLRSCSRIQRLELINFEKPLRVPDNGALMEICWSSSAKRKDEKTWICDERFCRWVKNYHRQFIMSPGFGGAKGFRSRKKFSICSQVSAKREESFSSFSDSLHLPQEKNEQEEVGLKLIQPYEHCLDMRWPPSQRHGEATTIKLPANAGSWFRYRNTNELKGQRVERPTSQNANNPKGQRVFITSHAKICWFFQSWPFVTLTIWNVGLLKHWPFETLSFRNVGLSSVGIVIPNLKCWLLARVITCCVLWTASHLINFHSTASAALLDRLQF